VLTSYTLRGEQPSGAGARFDAPSTSGRRLAATEALVTGPRRSSGHAGVRALTESIRSTTETVPSGPGTAGTSAWTSLPSYPATIEREWDSRGHTSDLRLWWLLSRQETERSLLTQRYFSSKPQGAHIHAENSGALKMARRLPLAIHGLSVLRAAG